MVLLAGVLTLGGNGCTYGPPEEHATVAQIVRLGDSYRAVAVIQRDVVRRPTGLNTFPDGGRWRFEERQAFQVLLDAEARRASRFASQTASDSIWESFGAHIAGVEGDSVVYLRLTGCPRNGECYPDLMNQRLLHLSLRGDARRVDSMPADANLPGTMLARAPGEEHYARFTVSRDTIAVRLEDDGPYRPMFFIAPNGTVEVIG